MLLLIPTTVSEVVANETTRLKHGIRSFVWGRECPRPLRIKTVQVGLPTLIMHAVWKDITTASCPGSMIADSEHSPTHPPHVAIEIHPRSHQSPQLHADLHASVRRMG